MTEFEIISRFFNADSQHSSVIRSIGDDCALLSIPPTFQLAVSMDTLVAGIHFPESASPEQIATRVFCTCISDLAAMGAIPRWFTLALTLPEVNEQWLSNFSQSLLSIANEYQCELVGGDTTRGPLTITLQVHGWVEKNKALLRSSAQVGDHVYVSNALGDGRAALDIILHNEIVAEETKSYLLNRFYQPQPQLQLGQLLVNYANSAIDISDGLLADLQHIAKASDVDIHINGEAIPVSKACRFVAQEKSLDYALTGGDDYQLAFTVSEEQVAALETLCEEHAIAITHIGKVVVCRESPAVYCYLDGKSYHCNQRGYDHFTS